MLPSARIFAEVKATSCSSKGWRLGATAYRQSNGLTGPLQLRLRTGGLGNGEVRNSGTTVASAKAFLAFRPSPSELPEFLSFGASRSPQRESVASRRKGCAPGGMVFPPSTFWPSTGHPGRLGSTASRPPQGAKVRSGRRARLSPCAFFSPRFSVRGPCSPFRGNVRARRLFRLFLPARRQAVRDAQVVEHAGHHGVHDLGNRLGVSVKRGVGGQERGPGQ